MIPMHILKTSLPILAACCLSLGGGACGDDDSSSSSNASNTPKKKARKKKATKATTAPTVTSAYSKIDPDLRRKLGEIDFVPDASGETNRDPFRSWVLRPTIDEGEAVEVVDICTEGKVRWGAESYSIRDLSLIGLVKRGRSYAQFSDRSERDSWIVRKGDCIGQEKAIIEEIGVGYVRLSITPPAPPGAPAPPAQKQDISLHPNELEIPDSIVNRVGNDNAKRD